MPSRHKFRTWDSPCRIKPPRLLKPTRRARSIPPPNCHAQAKLSSRSAGSLGRSMRAASSSFQCLGSAVVSMSSHSWQWYLSALKASGLPGRTCIPCVCRLHKNNAKTSWRLPGFAKSRCTFLCGLSVVNSLSEEAVHDARCHARLGRVDNNCVDMLMVSAGNILRLRPQYFPLFTTRGMPS